MNRFLPIRISAAIGNLESDDFETREEATRRLILTGKPAVAAVEQAVLEGELETQVRGITILEQMLFRGNMGAGIAALEALEMFAVEEGPTGIEASCGYGDCRQPGACGKVDSATFRVAGGQVERQGVSRKNALFANIDPLPTLTLLIGTDFKGTKTDLQRLRNVRVSQLLHRKSVEIDEETRKLLQEANPDLQIHPRDVYLGIPFQPGPESFFLIEVVPNSAAAEGGFCLRGRGRFVRLDEVRREELHALHTIAELGRQSRVSDPSQRDADGDRRYFAGVVSGLSISEKTLRWTRRQVSVQGVPGAPNRGFGKALTPRGKRGSVVCCCGRRSICRRRRGGSRRRFSRRLRRSVPGAVCG